MAKKTLGYIDLEWTCPSCGSRSPGTTKTCNTCGAPMPDDAAFELPAEQNLDTSEETAQQVAAGPDIHCSYCGARNRGDADLCVRCGGDLQGGEHRGSGETLGAFREGAAPEIACLTCGTPNAASRTHCHSCGAPLTKPEAPRQPAKPKRAMSKWILVGVLLAALACVLVMCQLSRGTKEGLGVVQDVEWTYAVQIEALTPVTREAWHDQVPDGVRSAACAPRVRRTVDEPVPGARQVCGTPYVRDTGTGKGEVVQDCRYEVSEDWCKYTVMEWRAVDTAQNAGRDDEPEWPVLRLSQGQREGKRTETYAVHLLVDDRSYAYHPDDLAAFRQFQAGSEWLVTTNALGSVTDVRPAN